MSNHFPSPSGADGSADRPLALPNAIFRPGAERVPVGAQAADPYYDQAGAIAYLGFGSVKTLERWRYRNLGPNYIKIMRRIFYRRSDLDAYLAQCVRVVSKGRPPRAKGRP